MHKAYLQEKVDTNNLSDFSAVAHLHADTHIAYCILFSYADSTLHLWMLQAL